VSGFHHKIDRVVSVVCQHILRVHECDEGVLEMSKERVSAATMDPFRSSSSSLLTPTWLWQTEEAYKSAMLSGPTSYATRLQRRWTNLAIPADEDVLKAVGGISPTRLHSSHSLWR
jgi:hypothetical protein